MPRSVNQGFDEFLSRLTPLSSQRIAAARHRERVKASLSKTMTVRSFRETGSFGHGTGVRNYTDVDVLAEIGGSRPGNSDMALRWVREALEASFPATKVYVSRPAVVVEFDNGNETWEVIPGFATARGPVGVNVFDVPGAGSDWMDSAPTAHLDYVNECNNRRRGTAGGAKKLARLLKAWKYYNEVPCSSFYLEMRAAEHVDTQANFIPVWDLSQCLSWLDKQELPGMNDPKKASGRFHACSSDATRRTTLSKLHTAAVRAEKALGAEQTGRVDDAFYYLNQLFNDHFPSR